MNPTSRSGWLSSKFQGALIGAVLLCAVFVFVVIFMRDASQFLYLCLAVVTLLGGYQATRVLESALALMAQLRGVVPKLPAPAPDVEPAKEEGTP